MKNLALIVAAGRGSRFGGEAPKQYYKLGNKTILQKAVEAFAKHPEIDDVLVVIAKDDEDLFDLDVPYCFGGEERQDSVKLGLEAAKKYKPDNVLIHDAARPYVSAGLISRVIEGLKEHDTAIPVIAVKDSVRVKGEAVNRDEVFLVQTPQGFHYDRITEAHKKVAGKFTDDAQLADAAGMKLRFVEGDEKNIKITTQADIKTPGAEFRTGTGFDVHEFETGTHVTICGIKIAHSHQLKGHSDADVGLHALTDAILGAIGEGDIGEHFPPSDMKWRNVDSSVFVLRAIELMKSKNGEISNVDITIICEEPKLTPYKAEMKQYVAKLLQLRLDCVNIKATTTEKLGFTGRKEGIAAQAVATVAFLG